MNKRYSIWILVVITFIIGFFIWQEYTKYKIATMVWQAFSWLWNGNKKINSKEEKKELIIVKKWDSYNFSSWEKESIKIKIREIKNYWKKYEWPFSSIEWTNDIVWVRLEGENVWKKQTFKSLSEYNIKLLTSDGMEFWAKSVEQVDKTPEWFGWCISCDSNPWEKNLEDILFDVDYKKIEWAKIILDDNDNVIFEL